MKMLKRANSLFLQCEISSAVLKTWITNETKTRITQNFQILYPIQGVPCESLRPKDSENVVLFGRASFLTGVIAAQSQQRAAKVCASPKIGNVTKN